MTTFLAAIRTKDLVPGRPYYVTVEACNGVFQCTTITSASLIADNSPPMLGIVKIGYNEEHSMYHSSV